MKPNSGEVSYNVSEVLLTRRGFYHWDVCLYHLPMNGSVVLESPRVDTQIPTGGEVFLVREDTS
jgi:hypothetical protein